MLVKAASYADILLASSLDLSTFLQADREEVLQRFPRCKVLSIRDRKATSQSEHVVTVQLVTPSGEANVAPTAFAVSETIGGGDAYGGCLLHALLSGADLSYAARFATAGFILKHQQEGDTFWANADEISALAERL